MARSSHDEALNRILARIGATLIRCQVVERHLKRCLTYVFPQARGEKVTVHLLRSREEEYSRREFGKLLKVFRNTMQVAAGFEDILKRFLTNRNTLAHSMLDLPGFNEQDSAATEVFLNQLYRDAVFIGDTLYAFIERWANEHIQGRTQARQAGCVLYLDALAWPKERK